MATRERRSWTAQEDQLLRDAVEKEDPGNPNPSKWHAIAKHVEHRTNKDCRKRWFAKMASDVVKGGWAPDEDERLIRAIEVHGTRWSLVATMVQTRNSDQCAKRWTDTLNPAIDRTTWTPDSDAMLIQAVNDHGKVWTKIVKTYFPGRTGLAAKNRYNSITRSNERRNHTSASMHRKAESISSSSSVSPITPSHSDAHYSSHGDMSSASTTLSFDNSRWPSPFTDRSATNSPRYATHTYSVSPNGAYSPSYSNGSFSDDHSVYASTPYSYNPQAHAQLGYADDYSNSMRQASVRSLSRHGSSGHGPHYSPTLELPPLQMGVSDGWRESRSWDKSRQPVGGVSSYSAPRADVFAI